MGNWKRGLRLAAPLLILPLGFLAYRPLNQWVILPWLGCGCPVMDAAGNLRAPGFCAVFNLFCHNNQPPIYLFLVLISF